MRLLSVLVVASAGLCSCEPARLVAAALSVVPQNSVQSQRKARSGKKRRTVKLMGVAARLWRCIKLLQKHLLLADHGRQQRHWEGGGCRGTEQGSCCCDATGKKQSKICQHQFCNSTVASHYYLKHLQEKLKTAKNELDRLISARLPQVRG